MAGALLVVAVAAGSGACMSSGHRVARPVHAPPPPPPPTTVPAAPAVVPVPAPTPPALVADALLTSVGIFPAPGAPPSGTLANPNPLGRPLVFHVLQQQGGWLEVQLPERPNGSTGWVQATDVALRQDPYRVTVELAARRLTVYQGDNPVMQTTVAIGTGSTPTPTGDFYIDGVYKLDSPNGPYGAYAMSVTAFSTVLTSFAGGNGQIALHGTNDPALLGTPASHGCVRMTNEAVTQLVSLVPPGTPVSIVG